MTPLEKIHEIKKLQREINESELKINDIVVCQWGKEKSENESEEYEHESTALYNLREYNRERIKEIIESL